MRGVAAPGDRAHVHEGADLLEHELPGSADLHVARANVDVFEQDAGVLLVQADGVLDDHGVAIRVVDLRAGRQGGSLRAERDKAQAQRRHADYDAQGPRE